MVIVAYFHSKLKPLDDLLMFQKTYSLCKTENIHLLSKYMACILIALPVENDELTYTNGQNPSFWTLNFYALGVLIVLDMLSLDFHCMMLKSWMI